MLLDKFCFKEVDLVLQGHDHNYQRSKQLTCATPDVYVAACVADDGADNAYGKGSGSVVEIAGVFPGVSNGCLWRCLAKASD